MKLLPLSDPPNGFNTWECQVCWKSGAGDGSEHVVTPEHVERMASPKLRERRVELALEELREFESCGCPCCRADGALIDAATAALEAK
jgi:hypothetical protein